MGFSLWWLPLLQSMGLESTGSVVTARGLSCSSACGIFLDQGSNPCPLHWQADSYPLCHQGSPTFLTVFSVSAELELNLLATLNTCCSLHALSLTSRLWVYQFLYLIGSPRCPGAGILPLHSYHSHYRSSKHHLFTRLCDQTLSSWKAETRSSMAVSPSLT